MTAGLWQADKQNIRIYILPKYMLFYWVRLINTMQRTCEVIRMGENSCFIFTCQSVKTVPLYDLKPVWVVLHPSVKEFFKTID